MAAAEARAAWQRAANRYFVQEDAKRAPKLACCQSSTSSSKQADSGLANAIDTPFHRVVGHFPFNRTPSYSNLSPATKWWLQTQPNQGLQCTLNFQQQLSSKTSDNSSQLNTNEDLPVTESVVMSEESMEALIYKEMGSFLDVKKPCESGFEELSVVDSSKVDQDLLDVKNMTDYYEFLEMEMVGSSICRKTSDLSSNTDSWIGGEKVPWWRVTDGEELASFVAQKSFHHIENCDLPPPQRMHVRREPNKEANLAKTKTIEHDEIYSSSLEWETQTHSDAILSPFLCFQQRNWSSVQGLSHNEDRASESTRTNSEARNSNNDPSKAKLLEALCHSQTRAREAENAAKKAYTEKEHILKLFFRQASQLFAYKQWFKLLQLENLLLQAEDATSPLTGFPDLLPWMAHEPRKKIRKNWQKLVKDKRCRRGSPENDIGKYAVAFAVGVTLVSAGLILGWTVGWLLPAF